MIEGFTNKNIEINKKGSLEKKDLHEIVQRVGNLLQNYHINPSLNLESLIKKEVQNIDKDRSKNELYAFVFLRMIEKGAEKMNLEVTESLKKYIEDAKDDHYIPGMEEELGNLKRAA